MVFRTRIVFLEGIVLIIPGQQHCIHLNGFWFYFGTVTLVIPIDQPTPLKGTHLKILQINSSARIAGSESTRLADAIVAHITARAPRASLVKRDLASDPHPVIDDATLQAIATPADQRNALQAARIALDDALIAQIKAADVLVIGAPMYNFGMSVQLKSWFDAVARAGETFNYTPTGPVGLLTGKKVYVGVTRGGVHRDGTTDAQVPHLKTLLGFLGMTDVTFIYAEGMGMGLDASAAGRAQAQAELEAAVSILV